MSGKSGRSGTNVSASSGRDKVTDHMSATEERRAIVRRVFELAEVREELDWAAQAADLAFRELDKLEESDAPPKSR